MIDTNKLRRLAQAASHPTTKGRWIRLFGERTVYDRMDDGCRGTPVVSTDKPPSPYEAACLDFIAAANPAAVIELLDRLEAAESEAIEQARLNGMGSEREAALMAKLEAAEKERDWHAERCEDAMNECDALRAKLEAAESDAAHQKALTDSALRVAKGWEEKCNSLRTKIEQMEKQEPVAYLPLSSARILESGFIANAVVWNCRDKAASDMPLYALPGAQPAPSVPDGWQLVPIEPTEDMLRAMTDPFVVINGDNRKAFESAYTAMLAAALKPEATP